MRIVGFTFIKNAIKYDYPIAEAIRSILPICDEVVVAVGKSEDNTLELVSSIDPNKMKIIETIWDEKIRDGGLVLAEETNKAFDAIGSDADWCFYIQGDEVLHEQYFDVLKNTMLQYKDDLEVEGLLFKYRHFYGSYDYIGNSRKWYRHEIRIIKNDKNIRSYKDAQGFRKHGKKLNVKPVDAYIHHYGWVKHPEKQQLKQQNFNKLWHSDQWVNENVSAVDEFDYSQIDSLKLFDGTHPKVIQQRIKKTNWNFSFDPTKLKLSLKERFSRKVEKWTGYRIGEYKNYKLLR
jgi:hypothetical protein